MADTVNPDAEMIEVVLIYLEKIHYQDLKELKLLNLL